jgi:SHS2 domain-containing protein
MLEADRKGETSMGRVETFDHTADLGLRINGHDLPDLFRTAAAGLFDVIVANRDAIEIAETEPVALEAESTEDLLVDWLNELIFRCETRHRLYGRFDIVLDDAGRRLDATIGGEPIDRGRHLLDHEVKAATRHGLSLRPENGGWAAEVILDI